jgi:hypothetical protein
VHPYQLTRSTLLTFLIKPTTLQAQESSPLSTSNFDSRFLPLPKPRDSSY